MILHSAARFLRRTGLAPGAAACALGLSLTAPIPAARAVENGAIPPNFIMANPIPGAIAALYDLPGLADGFIPQGLTVFQGDLYVAGYLWPSPGENACRIYRLNQSGEITGQRDLGAPCTHGGGMSKAGGRLFLSDTRQLFELDAGALFDQARNPILRTIPLAAPLAGSFAAGEPEAIWLGLYARQGENRLWRFPLRTLDALPDGAILDANRASLSMILPEASQGAAFAPDGSLWTTQSGQKFGRITRIDTESGAVLARYPAPTGIEDISFDEAGFLWATSETGTRRWAKSPAPFPHLYRIDSSKLMEGPGIKRKEAAQEGAAP